MASSVKAAPTMTLSDHETAPNEGSRGGSPGTPAKVSEAQLLPTGESGAIARRGSGVDDGHQPVVDLEAAQRQDQARAPDRAREARRLFNLPADEEYITDVFCSMKVQGMYLHGRLYLFRGCFGWATTSFGNSIIRIVPFQAVRAVRRRLHYGRPTALEVKHGAAARPVGGESRYTILASLEDREGVLASLMDLWGGQNAEAVEVFRENSQMQLTWREKKMQRVMGMMPASRKALARGGPAEAPLSSTTSSAMAGVPEDGGEGRGEEEEEEGEVEVEARAVEGNEEEEGEEGEEQWRKEWRRALSSPQACPDSVAPPLPETAREVAKGAVPYTLEEYMTTILLSDFSRRFQETQNSSDVYVSPWQPREDNLMGLSREMRFTIHRKNPIGPSTFTCHQEQRLGMWADQHVVFETEMSMPGIPYGDYFKVCTRWDLRPAGQQGMSWEMVGWVRFIKDTILRGTIFKNAVNGLKDSNAIQMAAILRHLAEQQALREQQAQQQPQQSLVARVENSLASLFTRVPSAMRRDVYSMVQAKIGGRAPTSSSSSSAAAVGVGSHGRGLPLPATGSGTAGGEGASRGGGGERMSWWQLLVGVALVACSQGLLLAAYDATVAAPRAAAQHDAQEAAAEQLRALLAAVLHPGGSQGGTADQ